MTIVKFYIVYAIISELIPQVSDFATESIVILQLTFYVVLEQ